MPKQMPPQGRLPRTIHDILVGWAYDLRARWNKEVAADFRRMVKDPEGYVRKCNWTCIIGPTGFQDGMYGTVWDFYNVKDGFIQPQDWEEPISPWLDAEYFRSELPDHPDQEILAMLERGVWYKTDLEFHIVLAPHSPGLKDGVLPIFKEVVTLAEERQWYGLFYDFIDRPPLLPERNTVRSAIP